MQDLAFSPDGKRIACARGGKLTVWDVAEGRVWRTMDSSNGVVVVAFSPDGKRIIASGFGGAGEVWDAATGGKISTLKGLSGQASCVAYSPDGTTIVSGLDKTLKVRDATSGKELLTLAGHKSPVNNVAFSPDGKRIASGDDDGTIRLWDAATGRELLKIEAFIEKSPFFGKGLVFSPDGKKLAGWRTSYTGNTHTTLKVWDAANGHELLTIKDFPRVLIRLAFSPDGTRIATAGGDGLVRIWDAANGQKLFDFKGHKGQVDCVAFSPDGKLLASGGMDGTLKLWDPACRQETLTLTGVYGAAFSPDGMRIVSGIASENRLRIWNAATGKQELSLKRDAARAGTPPTQSSAAVFSANRAAQLLQGNRRAMTSLAFASDGIRIAGGFGDGSVELWDAATGKQEPPLKGPDGAVTGIRFNEDGMMLATSMLDGTDILKLWGTVRGQRTTTLKASVDPLGIIYGMIPEPKPAKGGRTTPSIPKPHYPMTTVAFSPDGKRIVGGNLGIGVLTVWDALTGKEIVTLDRGEMFDAMDAAFSPDGKRIVVGCQGMVLHNHATLTVWDATSGTQTLALKGHNSMVLTVAYSPDGKRIVSGDAEGELKIWDASKGQETFTLKANSGGVFTLAFSRDGKRLVSGGADGTLKVWDASRGPERDRKPAGKLGLFGL